MKRMSVLGISSLLAISLLLKTIPTHAGQDCGERLDGRAYYCTATNESTPSSLGVLAFGPDANFAQGVNGVFGSFAFGPCYCGAKGNLKNPQIGAAASFICHSNNQIGIFLTGTATAKKINQGTLVVGTTVYFFQCTDVEG